MAEAASDPPRVLLLRVAYDGSGFAGYAKQPGLRTVEGVLAEALCVVLREESPLRMAVAGRTDAGVHALGQVVSVETGSDLEASKIERSLGKLLPPDISVSVEDAPPGFDARRWARSRRYRYRLLVSRRPDPLRRQRTWWVGPLPEGAEATLERAAALTIGEHDFKAFCKNPPPSSSTVRTVEAAEWYKPGGETGCCDEELWFEIEAWAFCHEMVRRLVGAMVYWALSGEEPAAPEDVGRFRWKPAPPEGLYLLGVRYSSR